MGFWQRLFSRKRKRQVFTFWDGTQTRPVDATQVIRALETDSEFDMATHPTTAAMVAPVGATPEDLKQLRKLANEAAEITIRAIRKAFNILPIEQNGLTEVECLAVLNDFGAWVECQKKTTNAGPT